MTNIAATKPSAIIALRQRLHEENMSRQEEFEVKMAILQSLPDASPAPDDVRAARSFADGRLYFSGAQAIYDQLIELYPPNPLSLVIGDQHKVVPTQHVSDQQVASCAVLQVHPVVATHAGVYWFATVRDLELKVLLNPGDAEIIIGGRGTGTVDPRSGCFLPRAPEPAIHATALDSWNDAWWTFVKDTGMNAKVQQFLNCFKLETKMYNHLPWTQERIPAASSRPAPGSAVRVPSGISTSVAIEALCAPVPARPSHPWDRIGNLRDVASAEMLEQMIVFAEVQRMALPAAIEAANTDLQSVEQAFTGFFAERSAPSPYGRESSIARIRDFLARKTGLSFSLKSLTVSPENDKVLIEFSFQDRTVYRTLAIPVTPVQPLLPQHVPSAPAA